MDFIRSMTTIRRKMDFFVFARVTKVVHRPMPEPNQSYWFAFCTTLDGSKRTVFLQKKKRRGWLNVGPVKFEDRSKLQKNDVVYGSILTTHKGFEYEWFVRANELRRFRVALGVGDMRLENVELRRFLHFLLHRDHGRVSDGFAAGAALFCELPALCNPTAKEERYTFLNVVNLLREGATS